MYGALPAQLIRTWEQGSELAVVNTMSTVAKAGLVLTLDAAHQLDSTATALTMGTLGLGQLGIGARLPASGSPATGSLGILLSDTAPGAVGSVQIKGIAVALAAGSVPCGSLLSVCTTAGSSLGHLQVAATGEEVVAQSLVDGTDGNPFLVRLFGSVSIHP